MKDMTESAAARLTYGEEVRTAAEALRETARRAPKEIWRAALTAPTSVVSYFKVASPDVLLLVAGALECFNPEEESGHDDCSPDSCQIASMVALARKINGSLT